MTPSTLKQVLVTGSGNPTNTHAKRAARMVASTLAEHGFALVAGNSPGVDRAVSAEFCYALTQRPGASAARFTQIYLPWLRRGRLWPVRAVAAPAGAAIERVRDEAEWLQKASSLADAAVILSGRGGTMRIASRFIEAGKPVFPVPFTGGTSSEVFQEVLRTWSSHPVPGLTRSQFLRLAVPWISGTEALADLLLGTLSTHPSIFVSYRRADSEWVAGRLRQDLAEHFGTKRVFMDLDHIEPGDDWENRIDQALLACDVGIVIVGGRWFDSNPVTEQPRVFDADDVLAREIRTLVKAKKALIVLTTPDAPPQPWNVPDDLAILRRIQTVTIANATWHVVLEKLIQTLQPMLRTAASKAGG